MDVSIRLFDSPYSPLAVHACSYARAPVTGMVKIVWCSLHACIFRDIEPCHLQFIKDQISHKLSGKSGGQQAQQGAWISTCVKLVLNDPCQWLKVLY